MAKLNKTCYVCGTEYTFCTGCEADDHKPRWMVMFDCDDCRIIFDAVTEYLGGRLSKEQAMVALRPVDLSDLSKYNTKVRHALTEILEAK